jgi:hypothetical protein
MDLVTRQITMELRGFGHAHIGERTTQDRQGWAQGGGDRSQLARRHFRLLSSNSLELSNALFTGACEGQYHRWIVSGKCVARIWLERWGSRRQMLRVLTQYSENDRPPLELRVFPQVFVLSFRLNLD